MTRPAGPPHLAPEYRGERDMESFWETVAPRREPVRTRWFLPAVLVLLAASVPWYLPAGSLGSFVWGLPIWMWTALVCSAGIALVTALAALRGWRDDQE